MTGLQILTYIKVNMPELWSILLQARNMPERLDYHPEGNTFDHILIVLSRAAKTESKELFAAALFHDLGKVQTYSYRGTRNGVEIHSYPSHEYVSLGIAMNYRGFISDLLEADFEKTLDIIRYHMRMKQYLRGDLKKPEKRKAIEELTCYPELKIFSRMDNMLVPFFEGENINSYIEVGKKLWK